MFPPILSHSQSSDHGDCASGWPLLVVILPKGDHSLNEKRVVRHVQYNFQHPGRLAILVGIFGGPLRVRLTKCSTKLELRPSDVFSATRHGRETLLRRVVWHCGLRRGMEFTYWPRRRTEGVDSFSLRQGCKVRSDSATAQGSIGFQSSTMQSKHRVFTSASVGHSCGGNFRAEINHPLRCFYLDLVCRISCHDAVSPLYPDLHTSSIDYPK